MAEILQVMAYLEPQIIHTATPHLQKLVFQLVVQKSVFSHDPPTQRIPDFNLVFSHLAVIERR
jgi:hypothetical protein